MYDLRYGKDYRRTVAIAHQQLRKIGSRCACCMINTVTELHHTEYGVREQLGVNYFGVCDRCHIPICHSGVNWIIHPTFGELLNHNTPEFVEFLQRNYQQLCDQFEVR